MRHCLRVGRHYIVLLVAEINKARLEAAHHSFDQPHLVIWGTMLYQYLDMRADKSVHARLRPSSNAFLNSRGVALSYLLLGHVKSDKK